MCMNVLPVFKFVHQVCAWHLQKLAEGIRVPGTGVTTVWVLKNKLRSSAGACPASHLKISNCIYIFCVLVEEGVHVNTTVSVW